MHKADRHQSRAPQGARHQGRAPHGGNCISANSNECDRPAKTDFRLGEHEKMDISKLRHAGNPIEVSRHSTSKLNKMKTDKYKGPIKREVVDDNIKMEVPDM